MQPLIDCAVCYKTYRDQIEQEPKPYVHCVHKTALTQVSLLTSMTNAHSKHGTRLHETVYDILPFLPSLLFLEQQEMKTTRVEHCNRMGYSSGSPTLLASIGTE